MGISLLSKLHDVPLAFVDVETTGASAQYGDRVIEVGIVRMEGGQRVAEYSQLINPQRRISAGITALTGITQAMCEGQPSFCEQLSSMLPMLAGAIIVGHNVRFDLSFLRRECRRSGKEITELLGETQVLDTVRIARRRFGRGGNGLQVLSRRLRIVPTVAHRALADAQTTSLVMEKLWEPIGGWNISLCDAMQEQGGAMGLLPASPQENLLPLELEEALESRKPVMMEYLDANEQRTHRVIEPIAVRRKAGREGGLMLVAFCQMRQAQRTFKLERIVQVTPAPPPPAFS